MLSDATALTIDEDARRSFEADWLTGRPKAIEAYLPPGDDPRYRATLEELVLIEMEFCWKRQSRADPNDTPRQPPVLAESYLQRFPVLNEPAVVLNLLREEFRLRHRHGDRPETEEYRRRFPALVITGQEVEPPTLLNQTRAETRRTPVCLRTPAPETPAWEPRPAPTPEPHNRQFPERYQVLGEIGRGGMGAVLRGRDVTLGRDIAIKVLLDAQRADPHLVQRFVEEAQIGGQLQHPGIVPVYELGRCGAQQPYFTMKLIQGRTLADLLKERAAGVGSREAVPGARFLGIFEQVCQTVAYAHARGVIHRDLKPANIMVGAFGEVQVMDWGLAKVLPTDDSAATASGETRPPETATVVRTQRLHSPASGRSSYSDTRPGSVLGTPAYMAPEQARGAVELLDERCDVFGLGAILCEILTGWPPYAGPDARTVLGKAKRSELDEARRRLEDCGADGELIALAKHCLEPDLSRRPRQAGEVAATMTAYLEAVQQRLRQAELERAQALVQAAEEQKRRLVERQRRRMTGAAAALLVLLVLGASSAGLWYQHLQTQREADDLRHQTELATEKSERAIEAAHQQAEQAARKKYLEKEIGAALQEAAMQRQGLHQKLADWRQATVLLSNLDEWQKSLDRARAAWQQAAKLAGSSKGTLAAPLTRRLQELDQQLAADTRDFQRAVQLDGVRLRAATLVQGKFDPTSAAKSYAALFAEWHLDPQKGATAQRAAQIQKSPLRYALVAALDDWAWALPFSAPSAHMLPDVLELVRAVDPDPWRNQVRDPFVWQDVRKMRSLAATAKPEQQTPRLLSRLAWGLWLQGARAEAQALLCQGLLHHPRDFWLHFDLAMMVPDPAEQAAYFRAALAVRPNSSPTHFGLGDVLKARGDLDGAIAHYQKAVDLDPNFALAHNSLGGTLKTKGNLAGAIRCYRKAIACDPNYASAHHNLGSALLANKDLDSAIIHFQKAVQLEPRRAERHYNLGAALEAKKDLAGAIASYQEAIKYNPKYGKAHHNLGNALKARGDLDGAIASYQKAIAYNPNDALAHTCLGVALHSKKNVAGAIACHKKALACDPKLAAAHVGLGNVLHDQQDLEGAIACYQEAIACDPRYALAHYNLGTALKAKGDLDGAIASYQKAIALDPTDARAHTNLGVVLVNKNDLPGAIACCQQALALDPRDVNAYTCLGVALHLQKDVPGAIACYQKAIACDPTLGHPHKALGQALLEQGLFRDARRATIQALKLLPPNQPLHGSTQKQLVQCEQLLALEAKLAAVRQGQAQPRDGAEQLALADLCRHYKKQYALAAQFYADAFRATPQLVEDVTRPDRYHAACAAAQAAAGRGPDGDKLSPKEKAQWRQQALTWLQADLAQWQRQTQGGQLTALATLPTLAKQLSHWQTNPDLADVRDAQALAQLPAAERQAWQQLWAEVDKLLQQVKR